MSTPFDRFRPEDEIEIEFDNGDVLVFDPGTPPAVIKDASRRYYQEVSGQRVIPPVEEFGRVTAAQGALTELDRAKSGVSPAPPPTLGGFFEKPDEFIAGTALEITKRIGQFLTDADDPNRMLDLLSAPSRGLGMVLSPGMEDLAVAERTPAARALQSGMVTAGSFVPSAAGAALELMQKAGPPAYREDPSIQAAAQDLYATGAELAEIGRGIPMEGPDSVFDIQGPEDMVSWMTNTLGKQAPIVAGLVGAGTLGGPAGLLTGAMALETGVTANQQYEEYGNVDAVPAAVAGVVAGALEATPIMLWLRRTRMGDNAMAWVGNRARAMIAQGAEEAPTEYAQELVEALGTQFIAENKPSFSGQEWEIAKFIIADTQKEALGAGAAGGFIGTVMGAAGGAGGVAEGPTLEQVFQETMARETAREKMEQAERMVVSHEPVTMESILESARQQIRDRRRGEELEEVRERVEVPPEEGVPFEPEREYVRGEHRPELTERQQKMFDEAAEVIPDRGVRALWASTDQVPEEYLEDASLFERNAFYNRLEEAKARAEERPVRERLPESDEEVQEVAARAREGRQANRRQELLRQLTEMEGRSQEERIKGADEESAVRAEFVDINQNAVAEFNEGDIVAIVQGMSHETAQKLGGSGASSTVRGGRILGRNEDGSYRVQIVTRGEGDPQLGKKYTLDDVTPEMLVLRSEVEEFGAMALEGKPEYDIGPRRLAAVEREPREQPPVVSVPAGRKRWIGDRGAAPGTPEFYLDVQNEDFDTAEAAITREEDDQGRVEWVATDRQAAVIARSDDLEELMELAENRVARRGEPAAKPEEIPIAERPVEAEAPPPLTPQAEAERITEAEVREGQIRDEQAIDDGVRRAMAHVTNQAERFRQWIAEEGRSDEEIKEYLSRGAGVGISGPGGSSLEGGYFVDFRGGKRAEISIRRTGQEEPVATLRGKKLIQRIRSVWEIPEREEQPPTPEIGDRVEYQYEPGHWRSGYVMNIDEATGEVNLRGFGTGLRIATTLDKIRLHVPPEGAAELPFEEEPTPKARAKKAMEKIRKPKKVPTPTVKYSAGIIEEIMSAAPETAFSLDELNEEFLERIARYMAQDEEEAALARLVGEGKIEPFGDGLYTWVTEPEPTARPTAPAVEAPPTPPPEPVPGSKQDQDRNLLAILVNQLDRDETPTAAAIFASADTIYGGTRAEGAYQESDVYDVVETAFNRVPQPSNIGIKERIAQIRSAEEKLPKQTARTLERGELQQFSTPPHYAAAVVWVANIKDTDTVLEPSAGTGNIVGRILDRSVKRVVANEISDRRANLLETIEDVDKVYREDADHLHALMAGKESPTVIVMNPPFSRDVKMGDKRQIGLGMRHVIQAVKLVPPGGRVVAIVGGGLSNAGLHGGATHKAPSYRPYFNEIAKAGGQLRANVRVSGDVYSRYGTKFFTRVLVIDKVAEGETVDQGIAPVYTEVANAEELTDILGEVRDERFELAPHREARGEEAAGVGRPAEERPGRRAEPVTPPGRVGEPGARPEAGARGGAVAPRGREPGRAEEGVRPGAEAPVQPPAEPSERGEPAAAVPGEPPRRGAAPGAPREGQRVQERKRQSLTLERIEDRVTTTVNEENVFDDYRPTFEIEGAQEHPSPLSESAAMSVIELPEVDYTPDLPKKAIDSGAISGAQLEPIIYAGAAFEQDLTDGSRMGFFSGDGTGVGKTLIIGGVILDHWRRGHKKAIVFTPDDKLWDGFKEEMGEIGFPTGSLFKLPKMGEAISRDEGILYVTYGTFIRERTAAGEEEVTASRFQQILDWIGKDFEGVVAFDEAHRMGNSLSEKVKIGKKKPSQTGVKGYQFQSEIPRARIMYASATGATKVTNLAFAQRLGLWGRGTPFPSREEFANQMVKGGISSMEVIAQDLKRLGRYIARNLRLEVEYDRLTHNLTTEQEAIYDEVAEAWKIILDNLGRALEATGMVTVDERTGRTKGSKEATAARRRFYGDVQRFFNNFITSLKVPTIISAIEQDLEQGYAPVIQVKHTGESALKRLLAQQPTADELQDVELNTLGILLHYLESAFPVQKIERYKDPDSDAELTRAAVDSEGKPIIDPEAVKLRDALLDRLGGIRLPELPLDQIVKHFGTDQVAEATGRKQRLIIDSKGRVKLEKRTNRHVVADIESFMQGKKKVLVFSMDAAGTGSNFHAHPGKGNQALRKQYVAEGGWRADQAVQALGRTNRAGQVQPPHWILVETNLPGERRFMSTVARRLQQLGALTKGSREASGQDLYTELDNLETEWAKPALHAMLDQLDRSQLQDFVESTGLPVVDTTTGGLKSPTGLPDISQFMNRLLALKIDDQNAMFNAFMQQYEMAIADAKQSGDYDNGTEVIKSDGSRVEEEQTVREEAGAKTKYIHLVLKHRNQVIPFEEVQSYNTRDELEFYQNTQSKRIYAIVAERSATERKTGRMKYQYRLLEPNGKMRLVDRFNISHGKNWEKLEDEKTARGTWNEAAREVPEFREESVHLVHGALIPIWDRFVGEKPQIRRITVDDGRTFLGRVIPPAELKGTLDRIGATREIEQLEPRELLTRIIEANVEVQLANQWKLGRRRVSGEDRIEITGPDYTWHDQLKGMGVLIERIGGYKTRYFVPTSKTTGPKVLEEILKGQQITDISTPQERGAPLDSSEDFTDHSTDFYSFMDPLAMMLDKLSQPFQARRPPDLDPIFIPPELRHEDPDVERRKMAARKGAQVNKQRELASAAGRNLKQQIAVVKGNMPGGFEYLDPNESALMALTVDTLRQYKAGPQFARSVAYDTTRNITEGLDAERLIVFTDYLALGDIIKDVEAGLYEEAEELPYGYTHPSMGENYKPETDILRDYERTRAIAEANPELLAAVQRRQQFQQQLTRKLVGLGILKEDVLDDPRYYHRQVLEYLNAERELFVGATGGVDLHMRLKSFQRRRKGGGDFNLAYHEAEFEYISQAMAQIVKVETLERLKRLHDKVPELKEQAKALNRQLFYQAEAEASNVPVDELLYMYEIEPSRDPLTQYRVRIARANQRIAQLASENALHVPGYDLLIDELSDAWRAHQAEVQDREEDAGPFQFDHPDWFRFLAQLGAQPTIDIDETPGPIMALSIFKAIREREEHIKNRLGRKYRSWRHLIPDGFVTWQPREGMHFFMGHTISDKVLDQVLAGEKLLTDDDVRDMLIMGGPRETWVIPAGLAKTLTDWNVEADTGVGKAAHWLLSSWKQWVLLNPLRMVRYNFNNMSGDLDIVLAYDPRILKGFSKAASDLWSYQVTGKPSRALAKELQAAMKLGVIDSGMTIHEIPEIKRTGAFRALVAQGQDPNAFQKAAEVYWGGVRNLTTWRENILRLAAFRHFQTQIAAGKKVYGASVPDQIDAVTDPDDKAAKLARELVGDYGNITAAGQWMRTHLLPFYSWMEINAPRYVRLIRNLKHEGRGGAGRGAAVGAAAVTRRAAIFALKAHILYTAVTMWNRLRFPDEDRRINKSRRQLHLILGHRKDGSLITLRFEGALSDALEWFGLEEYPQDIADILRGNKDAWDMLSEAGKAPVNRFVQSWEPFSKTTFELIMGRSSFPSIFEEGKSWKPRTRPIRNRWEHLARTVSMDWLVRKVSRIGDRPLPKRPKSEIPGAPGIGGVLDAVLFYRTDPGEAAYWYAKHLGIRFLKEKGEDDAPDINPTKRANALYYHRKAIVWGDEVAAEKWLREYKRLGGTAQGYRQSIKRAHPLGFMATYKRKAFLASLSAEDRQEVQEGIDWYFRVYRRNK